MRNKFKDVSFCMRVCIYVSKYIYNVFVQMCMRWPFSFLFFFPLLTFMSWVAAELLCNFFKAWEMKCLSKRKGDPFHLWCLSMHIYLKDLKGTCVMKKMVGGHILLKSFSLDCHFGESVTFEYLF